MWLVSTFEKIYFKKIFFVSTFLDWYIVALLQCVKHKNRRLLNCVFFGILHIIILRIIGKCAYNCSERSFPS